MPLEELVRLARPRRDSAVMGRYLRVASDIEPGPERPSVARERKVGRH